MQPVSSGDVLSQYSQGQRNFRGLSLAGLELPLAHLNHSDFAQCNLSQVNWSGADLIKVNFSKANLRGAKLIGADLSGANLVDADLRGAMLSGAILIGAYLSRANLEQAVLSGAVLNGAVLRDCRLKDANLVGAVLAGADLTGAHARQSDLAEANLEGATLPDGSVVFTPDQAEAPLDLDLSSDSTFGVGRPDLNNEVDNETLIRQFLTTPSEQVVLRSNLDLRIEPVTPGASQLVSRQGEVVAKFVHGGQPATVSLYQDTSFTTLVGEVLAELEFLPQRELTEPACVDYQHCPILSGYCPSFEAARRLWKTWWMGGQADQAIPDVLVWWQNQWVVVADISFAAFPDGEITIQLGNGQAWTLSPNQKINWLQRETNNPGLTAPELANPSAQASTVMREIIQFQANQVIIQSSLGEIKIQGENLRCWLNQAPLSPDTFGTD